MSHRVCACTHTHTKAHKAVLPSALRVLKTVLRVTFYSGIQASRQHWLMSWFTWLQSSFPLSALKPCPFLVSLRETDQCTCQRPRIWVSFHQRFYMHFTSWKTFCLKMKEVRMILLYTYDGEIFSC